MTENNLLLFAAAIVGLLIVALVFRWVLSIGRQIRQQDRLFELMGRMAQEQGISRDEINWIWKRHQTPMSSTDIRSYQDTFNVKKETA